MLSLIQAKQATNGSTVNTDLELQWEQTVTLKSKKPMSASSFPDKKGIFLVRMRIHIKQSISLFQSKHSTLCAREFASDDCFQSRHEVTYIENKLVWIHTEMELITSSKVEPWQASALADCWAYMMTVLLLPKIGTCQVGVSGAIYVTEMMSATFSESGPTVQSQVQSHSPVLSPIHQIEIALYTTTLTLFPYFLPFCYPYSLLHL